MPHEPTLTLSQAAQELDVPAPTLRRWTNRGQVPFMKTPGGQRRFTRQQIRQIRKQVLTAPEAASELGVAPSTLRRWAIRGLVPYMTTATGARRFTWSHIQEIRAKMRQQAENPSTGEAA